MQRFEPGPAYLAFFTFLLFATAAGASEESTLVGWPLALAVATVAAAAYALRPRT
jgi:hypothetical protein